jgi:hypothetical protein
MAHRFKSRVPRLLTIACISLAAAFFPHSEVRCKKFFICRSVNLAVKAIQNGFPLCLQKVQFRTTSDKAENKLRHSSRVRTRPKSGRNEGFLNPRSCTCTRGLDLQESIPIRVQRVLCELTTDLEKFEGNDLYGHLSSIMTGNSDTWPKQRAPCQICRAAG